MRQLSVPSQSITIFQISAKFGKLSVARWFFRTLKFPTMTQLAVVNCDLFLNDKFLNLYHRYAEPIAVGLSKLILYN